MIKDDKMYVVTLRVVTGNEQTNTVRETCSGKKLKGHLKFANVVNYDEVGKPINSKFNYVITLFSGGGTQVYVVKHADNLEDSMNSAISHYRKKFGLFHLPEDGIGKMNATSVGTPPNCHVIDMDEPYNG